MDCENDPVLALLWMRRGVELGDTQAQVTLGGWYLGAETSPLPVNFKEALRLSRLAADKGHAMAICNVGILFARGCGVPPDIDEACQNYCRAAALGHELAKDLLREQAGTGHAPALAAVRELGLAPP